MKPSRSGSLRQANEPMEYTTLGVLMGGQIAVWIVALATDVLWRPMRAILGTRATYVAQHDLAEKASRVPYRCYEDSAFYNKIEAAEQRKGWPEYTSLFLFQAISSILGLVSVAGLLSLFSGWLSLIVIVAAIPYFLSQLRYILDGHELFRYQSSDRRPPRISCKGIVRSRVCKRGAALWFCPTLAGKLQGDLGEVLPRESRAVPSAKQDSNNRRYSKYSCCSGDLHLHRSARQSRYHQSRRLGHGFGRYAPVSQCDKAHGEMELPNCSDAACSYRTTLNS